MQRMMIWGGLTCLSACLVKPTLVSIAPDYGYVDGCVDVTIQGNHLGENATGDVGGEALLNVTPPEVDKKREDYAQDVGFLYTAQVPPAKDLQPGFADVHLKVDGEELTMPLGFYYRACPASFIVDSRSPAPEDGVSPVPMAAGDSLSLVGCGLSAANVTVEYHLITVNENVHTGVTGDTAGTVTTTSTSTVGGTAAATSALVEDCSTARSHTVIPPGLAPGDYEVWLRHTDGTLYSADNCTARGGTDVEDYTTPSYYGYTSTVTWLGDSPAACARVKITVGGAR